MASNFTDDLAERFESWRPNPTDSVDHDEVMRNHRRACLCADFQETITLLNALLGAICQLTERHRKEVLAGTCRCNPPAEIGLQDGLRDLARALAGVNKSVEMFEREGFEIDGAREFRFSCQKIDRFVQDDNRRRELAERIGLCGVALEDEATDVFNRLLNDPNYPAPRSKYGSEAARLIDPSLLVDK